MKVGTQATGTHKFVSGYVPKLDNNGNPIRKNGRVIQVPKYEEKTITGEVVEICDTAFYSLGIKNKKDGTVYWFPIWGLKEA